MDDPIFYTKRARDGTRTRDPHLGKVVLHQLSHSRLVPEFQLVETMVPISANLKLANSAILSQLHVSFPNDNGYSIGTLPISQGIS